MIINGSIGYIILNACKWIALIILSFPLNIVCPYCKLITSVLQVSQGCCVRASSPSGKSSGICCGSLYIHVRIERTDSYASLINACWGVKLWLADCSVTGGKGKNVVKNMICWLRSVSALCNTIFWTKCTVKFTTLSLC